MIDSLSIGPLRPAGLLGSLNFDANLNGINRLFFKLLSLF